MTAPGLPGESSISASAASARPEPARPAAAPAAVLRNVRRRMDAKYLTRLWGTLLGAPTHHLEDRRSDAGLRVLLCRRIRSRVTPNRPSPGTDHRIAFYRIPTDSIGEALGDRRVRISRIGGWPKKRLYSRLNWLALSYPTSKAALAASRPSMSMRPRAACNRSCFRY